MAKRTPKRQYVVTGRRPGSTRDWYAYEKAGDIGTDVVNAKRWISYQAAGMAAQALANVTGRPWHVVDVAKG